MVRKTVKIKIKYRMLIIIFTIFCFVWKFILFGVLCSRPTTNMEKPWLKAL